MFQIFWLNVKACTLLLLGIGFPIFSPSLEVIPTLKEHRPGMQIRKLLTLIVIAWLLPAALSAQTLSVQFKVRETRLFGLSGERFAKLELSNQNRITPLTSENVNGGQFYYFVFRPAGDWKVDADFVKEEIPRLVLRQNEKIYPIASAGEIMSDTTSTFVFLGFPKELKLYLPFSSQFRLPDSTIEVGFVIPEEYWPGYSLLTEALKSTERAIEEKRYHDAIGGCEQALRTEAFLIFPQVTQFRGRRTHTFESFHNQGISTLVEVISSDKKPLKERIGQLDEVKKTFQFVLDSLPNPQLDITAADSAVKRLLDYATIATNRIRTVRDSLQRALDDQNVRWIVEGSATGKNGSQYQYMVETLAYAFSSMDFSDTTVNPQKLVLPPEIQARLTKENLDESYTTFVRQCSARVQRRLPMFPPEFLTNLRKDTASFFLPYYSMLQAVNDYYAGTMDSGKTEITNIFRSCYDPELTARFDQMRILLDTRRVGGKSEALKVLAQAAIEESAGNNDAASEHYREAMRIAPDFAYATYRWGLFFARTGDPIRAQTFFERAYQSDTMYISAYRQAYILYRKSGNYKAMIDVLTRALERGNDFWEINFNLGLAYFGDGDLARAIRQFDRALELSPNNYETDVQLGLAHQTAKNYQKAREYFHRAILIDPYRTDAVELLNKLNELQKNAR